MSTTYKRIKDLADTYCWDKEFCIQYLSDYIDSVTNLCTGHGFEEFVVYKSKQIGLANTQGTDPDADHSTLRTDDECPNCLCGTVEKVEVDGLVEICCRGECGSIIWSGSIYSPTNADLRTGDDCPNCGDRVEVVEVDGTLETRCMGENDDSCGALLWDEVHGDYEMPEEACECGKPVCISDQTKPGDPAWDGCCGDCHTEHTHVGDWRVYCYDKDGGLITEIIIENRNHSEAQNEARRHPEIQHEDVDDWTMEPIYEMDKLLDEMNNTLDAVCPPDGETKWACADQKIALDEGWDIFSVSGSSQPGDYQIQRDDEMKKMQSDSAAWHHVVAQAVAGNKVHVRALQFIREHSPEEYKRIVLHVSEG